MAINNSQYNAIIREYEKIQSEARLDRKKRIAEVYEKIPQMKELDTRAGTSALERYRRITMEGKKDALDNFSSEIKEIKIEKEKLLNAHGFASDYMELYYKCKDCRDTGFVEGKKCHCFKQRVNKLLYAQSNMDRILSRENFAALSYEVYDDTEVIKEIGMTSRKYMEKIVGICRDFINTFHTENENIMFIGNTGVGKTFLANCIAKELLDKGHSVIYMTATEFFDSMGRAKFERDSEITSEDMLEYLTECELLIIDDLGTEMVNSFTSSSLFYIINRRLNMGRSVIISSNLSLKKLRDIYTERVTSRISSSYWVIPIYGEDIRLKLRV